MDEQPAAGAQPDLDASGLLAVVAHALLNHVAVAHEAIELAAAEEHGGDHEGLLAVAARHLDTVAEQLQGLLRGLPPEIAEIDLRTQSSPAPRGCGGGAP